MLLNFFNIERGIHSLKTAFACLIGYIITKAVHMYVDQWLIITIIVVMCAQINVGGVLQKSYMRFLGTLSGSILAIITLEVLGTDEVVLAFVIPITALFFSYIATSEKSYSDAGTLGAATVVIILVGQQPSFITAIERFFEISIGILIAALVSQFVLPIHARRHLCEAQADTIRQLRQFYLTTLVLNQSDEQKESFQETDESIVKSLITQRKLANEAIREPLGDAFNLKHFQQILASEKEILRCINFMHRALKMSPNGKVIFSKMSALHQFNDAICLALEKIADSLEKTKNPIVELPDISALKSAIEAENRLIEDDMVCLHAYLFCAEVLIIQLRILSALKREIKEK